jgi:hypothetical protein
MTSYPRHVDLTPEARRNRRDQELRTRVDRMHSRQVLEKPQTLIASGKRIKYGVTELDPMPLTGGTYLPISVLIPSMNNMISVYFWMSFYMTSTVLDTSPTVALYLNGNLISTLMSGYQRSIPGLTQQVSSPTGASADLREGGPRQFLMREIDNWHTPSDDVPAVFSLEFGGSATGAFAPWDVREGRLWIKVE